MFKKLIALTFAMLMAASVNAAAQYCDVIYTIDVDVVTKAGADPLNVNTIVGFAYGLPLADAEDNTRLGKKVINEASKQQDKGGPYIATYSEMRSCDGKPAVRADGVFVQGVTLMGSVKIADTAIAVGKQINDRYRKRADKGDKFADDGHVKAKVIKRDPNTGKRERPTIVAGD